jgi:SAM-dependent methyltransferase
VQCGADDLPFPDNSFDVAVARFAVMFFADPLADVREALRVIRDGGQISFVVWSREEANPFFTTVADVLERFVQSPKADPDAPDAFRFAAPGKLAGIFKHAGVEGVVERELNFRIEAAISTDQFWQLRTEMSEKLREKLAGLTQNQIEVIKREVIGAAQKYFAQNKMRFPAQALIVSGAKPGC